MSINSAFINEQLCSQKMRIRWNGAYSDTFTICNGVKQGGFYLHSCLTHS